MAEGITYLERVQRDMKEWVANRGALPDLERYPELLKCGGALAVQRSITEAIRTGTTADVSQTKQRVEELDKYGILMSFVAQLTRERLEGMKRGTDLSSTTRDRRVSVEVHRPGVIVAEGAQYDGGLSWNEPRIARVGEYFDGTVYDFNTSPLEGGYLSMKREFLPVTFRSLIDPIAFTPRVELEIFDVGQQLSLQE